MYQRMRLKPKKIYIKKKHKLKISQKLLIIFLSVIIVVSFSLKKISDIASPALLSTAELEARKLAGIVINACVQNNISQNMDESNLFLINKDTNNNITDINFNTSYVNQILYNVTKDIENNLKKIEAGNIGDLTIHEDALASYDLNKMKKGIIYEITTGALFNNAILANIGPKIPVKISLVGDIISSIKTDITNYGINNVLVEIKIKVSITEMVLLPITSDEIVIETEIPVAIKLIQGIVPDYYFNTSSNNSPSYTLPVT